MMNPLRGANIMCKMFFYKVSYWDSEKREDLTESGLIASEKYGTAAGEVVDYYGEDYVDSIEITELQPILSKVEIMDQFKEVKS